jgi:hypothetical protein
MIDHLKCSTLNIHDRKILTSTLPTAYCPFKSAIATRQSQRTQSAYRLRITAELSDRSKSLLITKNSQFCPLQ